MPTKPLPEKPCEVCGRRIVWRKKWERDWDNIKVCSEACRKGRLDATDVALERAIMELLGARRGGGTICPSEAARRITGDEGPWEALMERARMAARRLVAKGSIEITQGGRAVDGSTAKGPIRLRKV
jgi:hypothetical protein